MRYYIVDAFTDKPFGGNPAGVAIVGNDGFPNEELMLHVAAELRYSETAFVQWLSPGEYRVRYFTPAAEVELCGHATIATFSLLHGLGLAAGRCLCHTLAGDMSVEVGENVLMQMAAPRIEKTVDDTASVYRSLGLDGYRPVLPVQVVYSGLSDLMIEAPDVPTLNNLRPDMEAIAALTERHEAVSFHVFALGNDEYTAHVRDFAPRYDVSEESATGTANAALTHYLATHGVIAAQGDHFFLQGEAMGRPSVVMTRLSPDGTLCVGGTACVLAEGILNV